MLEGWDLVLAVATANTALLWLLAAGLEQGELVTVAATPNLGRVRRLVRASQGE